MTDFNSDYTMLFVSITFIVLLLFCTGLYFILRSYSSDGKRSEDDGKSKPAPLDSKKTPQLDIRSDVNRVSLKDALSKSRNNFWSHLKFTNTTEINQTLEQIEEALYLGDVGPQTVSHLVQQAQKHFSSEKLNEQNLKDFLKKEMNSILGSTSMSQSVFAQMSESTGTDLDNTKLHVLLVVGVNGVGKTTTIGKLAQNLVDDGKKVLIAAGDTFRAAAGEQLKVWTDRAQAELYFPEGVKDPSAVAFGAVKKALSDEFDVCIIDTAGRLHTQDNLMAELEKVKRVIAKLIPAAPQHRWIVLDANSGQNALFQAKIFHQKLDLNGVILTKLDGTAKGGMALAVANELKAPIRFIGVGEKSQDLRPFAQKEFVESLL